MGIGEDDAFSGNPVDVRCGYFTLGIVATGISQAHVIGQDDDDIGFGYGGLETGSES